MATDPSGQTPKMAYLHWKRLNFIKTDENEIISPWADIEKRHIYPPKSEFILLISNGV